MVISKKSCIFASSFKNNCLTKTEEQANSSHPLKMSGFPWPMIMNAFVKETTMGVGSSYTENGALSYATAGTALIDQFGKAGTARARDINMVWNEQATLWSENPELALRFPFYLRMITRKTQVLGNSVEISKVQRGQGARDEAFKRFLWIERYHPEKFYRNLWLVPVVGSWKDL